MKKLFLILSFFTMPLFATNYINGVIIDASANNLAGAYNTSFPQLAVTGLTAASNHFALTAPATGVCCELENPSIASAPTAGNGHELCAPAGVTKLWDFVPILGNVYCRSIGSAITTGTIIIETW